MKKLPRKIRLGYITYEISYESTLVKRRLCPSSLIGNFKRIEMQSTMPLDVQRMDLFCLVHLAISDKVVPAMPIKCQKALAALAHSVLRDNHRLLKPPAQLLREIASVRMFGFEWALIPEKRHWPNSGAMDSMEHEIYINPALPEQEQWLTFWHEVYHILTFTLRLETESETEHDRIVELLSFFMCTLLHQNDLTWAIEEGEQDV